MRTDHAEAVATKLIEQLQQGTAPWQKPWAPGEQRLPYNPTTGKPYRGINSMWLEMQGRGDPRWMTYKQAAAEGAQVRKGEKGTRVEYWKFRDERQATDAAGNPIFGADGKPKMETVQLERPRMFAATVFNADQIDGLPPREPRPMAPEHERHERAEAILDASGAKISHVNGNRAFYSPSTDAITLPERQQFHSPDGYYATALHELGHWTGHQSRLDRDLAHPFGSEGYAREELRAEIASLMLGDELGIGHDPGQHAAYVGSWIKALKDDPREIFRAAADAEKINSYVLGSEQERERTTPAPAPEFSPGIASDEVAANLNGLPQSNELAAAPSVQETPAPGVTSVPEGWRHAAARIFDEEMAASTGNPDYDQAQRLSSALRQYEEMSFEPLEQEQAILDERKTAMDEASQWMQDNVLRNPVVKARMFETVRDFGRDTGDPVNDKVRHDYLAEMSAKQPAHTMTDQQQAVHAAITQAKREAMLAGYERWQPTERESNAPQDDARVRMPVLHEPPEAPMQGRTYLAVPYAEKDEAKALGAKWDKAAKAWYAPDGVSIEASGLDRWAAGGDGVIASQTTADPRVEFARALREAGLQVEGLPVMDGQMQRVPVEGDRRDEKSGAYAGHLTGQTPGGYIKNHKTGVETSWKSSTVQSTLGAQQRAALNAEAAMRRQQRMDQREEQQERAAQLANSFFNEADPADPGNAYAEKKDMRVVGLRQVPPAETGMAAPGVHIAKTPREAKKLREDHPDDKVFLARDLLVPARDFDGTLWSLQSVNPTFKSFMKDGRKHGLHALAGTDKPFGQSELATNPALPLIVAEGYATGDTLAGALGHPVVVAFDSGNLQAVAEQLRERYPDRPIFIAGDNDHAREGQIDQQTGQPKVNVGKEKAIEAAAAVGGATLLPPFAQGEKGSDWNDRRQAHGSEAVRQELVGAIAVASVQTAAIANAKAEEAHRQEQAVRRDPKSTDAEKVQAKERRKTAMDADKKQPAPKRVRRGAAAEL